MTIKDTCMSEENIVVTGKGVQFGWTIVATSVLLAIGFYITSVLVPIEMQLNAVTAAQLKQDSRLEVTDKRLDGLTAMFTDHSIEAVKTEARQTGQLERLRFDYDKFSRKTAQ